MIRNVIPGIALAALLASGTTFAAGNPNATPASEPTTTSTPATTDAKPAAKPHKRAHRHHKSTKAPAAKTSTKATVGK